MDDTLSKSLEGEDKTALGKGGFLPFFALAICGIALFVAAWNDTFSRFQEFQGNIDLYKIEIYFFISISSVLVIMCFLGAKRWGMNLLPVSVLAVLLVGATLGGAISSQQNEHRYGTDRNGPVNMEDIASSSPQIRARETFLTYMRLDEFLENATISVHRNNSYFLYLNGFSGANVEVDKAFDPSIIPFDRMAGMKMILESSIYQDRKLYLYGQGDSYHFFSTPQIDYLVAD